MPENLKDGSEYRKVFGWVRRREAQRDGFGT